MNIGGNILWRAAGLCQYFFAAHKCQQYCGTHFPVFLELCLYLVVARDLVNFSSICNRCLIHLRLDKPLSARESTREGEKNGRLMLDSFDVYICRNKSRILLARNDLFFVRSFRRCIALRRGAIFF